MDASEPNINQQPTTEPQPPVEVKEEIIPTQSVNEENKTKEVPKPHKPVNVPLIILIIIVTALFTSAAVCFAIFLTQNNAPSQDNDESTTSTVNEPVSLDNFGFEFAKLENEEGKNMIYSPLSIKYALAMLSDATAGESKAQIENLVGDFSVNKYTNNDKQSLANAIFVREKLMDQVHESYTQTLKQKYDASIIADPFTSETPLNDWVSNKTFGMINNLFDDSVLDSDFVLLNALAIDMNWNNRLQCIYDDSDNKVPCMYYNIHFAHENYNDFVEYVQNNDSFSKIDFNGQETSVAKIGASANNYDIISELGEEYIRSTVQSAYDEWLKKAQEDVNYPEDYDIEFNIDKYMEELSQNYGRTASSTDFYFSDTDTEKIFAKDLQENEGSTLQYIGIMPKNETLDEYIDNITSEKITNIANNLNDVSTIDGFKKGVVTKVSANIPFFDFDYKLKLVEDLKTLGITDVFSMNEADLSQMTSLPKSYIQNALHKANIDFSNDGIKAAAATALSGGFGAGGDNRFEYEWDVPIEEIDLTFNKPFFFIIHDKATGEVWFTGAVYQPSN